MNSNMTNAEIIRHFASNILSDKKEHTVSEIKEYVEKQVALHIDELKNVKRFIFEEDRYFTDGMYSGALKELLSKNPDIKIIVRGVYQWTDNNNERDNIDLRDSVVSVLKSAMNTIRKNVASINIGTTTQETIDTILEIRELLKDMEQQCNNFDSDITSDKDKQNLGKRND